MRVIATDGCEGARYIGLDVEDGDKTYSVLRWPPLGDKLPQYSIISEFKHRRPREVKPDGALGKRIIRAVEAHIAKTA